MSSASSNDSAGRPSRRRRVRRRSSRTLCRSVVFSLAERRRAGRAPVGRGIPRRAKALRRESTGPARPKGPQACGAGSLISSGTSTRARRAGARFGLNRSLRFLRTLGTSTVDVTLGTSTVGAGTSTVDVTLGTSMVAFFGAGATSTVVDLLDARCSAARFGLNRGLRDLVLSAMIGGRGGGFKRWQKKSFLRLRAAIEPGGLGTPARNKPGPCRQNCCDLP